jgi:hypothetical protein
VKFIEKVEISKWFSRSKKKIKNNDFLICFCGQKIQAQARAIGKNQNLSKNCKTKKQYFLKI